MAEAGYEIAIRCSDAPHMRFNIADAHVGALVLAGRISDALEVAEWARGPGSGFAGDGAHVGAGDSGPGGAGSGPVGGGVPVVGSGGGCVVGDGP